MMAQGEIFWGAVVGWHIYNLFDTLDGRIARLKGTGGSEFGEYVDAYGGYWVYFLLMLGLSIGLYRTYGSVILIFACFVAYFLSTIHFIEGLQVGFLLGGKKHYKKIVLEHLQKEGRSKKRGLISRILGVQAWMTKRFGLQEPFNMTDVQHMLLFYIPLFSVLFFPIYLEGMIFICAMLLLYQLLWYLKYKDLLQKAASEAYKHE
jgi:hypothetical protein